VLTASAVLAEALHGVAAGLRFHPIYAALAVALAAGLVGYRKSPYSNRYWALAAVFIAWTLGDGVRLLGSGGSELYLAACMLTGLGVGYFLPGLAGAYVGRQVHRGTGYLSAGAIAIMLVFALSTIAAPVADAIARAVG
jgi:hypothetical protein